MAGQPRRAAAVALPCMGSFYAWRTMMALVALVVLLAQPPHASCRVKLGVVSYCIAALHGVGIDHHELVRAAPRIYRDATFAVLGDRTDEAFGCAARPGRFARESGVGLFVDLQAQCNGQHLRFGLAVTVLGVQALTHGDGLSFAYPCADHRERFVLRADRRRGDEHGEIRQTDSVFHGNSPPVDRRAYALRSACPRSQPSAS